jgi:hypothetical protein
MHPRRIGGIVLLVVGAALFSIGLNASDSFTDQFSEFFTGHFTDKTTWLMLGGATLAIVGLAGLVFVPTRV